VHSCNPVGTSQCRVRTLYDEATKAELVIEAYERSISERRGAFEVAGKLIDAADLRVARTIVQKARLSRARENQNPNGLTAKENRKHG
jgi:hypothetical protein